MTRNNRLTHCALYDRRTLPAEERVHWDEVAAKDKQRYLVEKASYTGPWQVPWKRAKKDPSAPKRPMSAFLYFSLGRRTKIKAENPGLKNTEVSRMLGEMWRNLGDEGRKPYVDKELEEREKYKVAIAEWRMEDEKKKEEEKKILAAQQAQWAKQQSQQQHYMMEGGGDSSSTGGRPPGQAYPGQQYALPPPPPHTTFMYPQAGGPPPPSPYYAMYGSHPPGPYPYPMNGKQPIILGPNGMPHYQAPPPPPMPASAAATSTAGAYPPSQAPILAPTTAAAPFDDSHLGPAAPDGPPAPPLEYALHPTDALAEPQTAE